MDSKKNTRGTDIPAAFSCPLPIREYGTVLLAHGGGGRLTRELIQKMFLPQFRNELLAPLHDGAVFSLNGVRCAFSTDSYVIQPLFFPGGDIGKLAVCGTVNDLAMCGAHPKYLSVGMIIEEGLPMDDLWRVVLSMQEAAGQSGVMLVTGDTKVVDRGKGDKLFINTSGLGVVPDGVDINPSRAAVGDRILINGPIAMHGVSIMSVREGVEFQTTLTSDVAPLNGLVEAMLDVCPGIHVLRDPTRGGVASALNEIASASDIGISIVESLLPVSEEVKGACEILGLDPLYVANEGKLIAFVPADLADRVLRAMRGHPLGKESVIFGEVTNDHHGTVVMQSSIGGKRIVDMLSGEQLPRIC